ncbi:hypothetical protein [Paenibacillus sp. J22TS3]|uniref:hypothetical protein n=1 Tax=Paenibacillus sp. J22TS3 TaxID=2807192 RepID=UPI001B2AEE79|nr:hypothetical protein [Paenibacillus sp. J22TS3]GIP20434.1 hypothetical protein J22TS3_07090 [Paenibacillus sp. J22TS3]
MRGVIKQKISMAVPELAGRVYDVDAALSLPLPLCIVKQGEETVESPWTGYRRYFDVIPYGAGGFTEVDQLSEQIIRALNEEVLTSDPGQSITCIYTGNVGGDTVDTERKAAARTLRFSVMNPSSNLLPSDPEDPWLTGLQSWTEGILGPEWAVYSGWWPSGYKRPCVLWRLTGSELKMTQSSGLENEHRFSVHVIGRSPEEEQGTVRRLLEAIGGQVKLPLEAAGKRYAVVRECTANPQADRIAAGQLTVLLSMKTGRTFPEEPLMQKIYYKPNPEQMR